jgi:NADH-quinone oxidoreductase subunit N
MTPNWNNFFIDNLPQWWILGMGMMVLFLGLFTRGRGQGLLLVASLAGIAGSFATSLYFWELKLSNKDSMVTVDPFANYFYLVILLIGFLVCLNHYAYFKKQKINHPEVYPLTLFALSGMMLMVSTSQLILFFLALEVMSLAVYILVGIKRFDLRSNESSMKYFILGAMVAGIFLFGAALIYGASGTLDLRTLSAASIAPADQVIFKIGVTLVLIAFAFKVAAVPFHFWTPDVYEGSPVSVTGFMATGVKAAAFGGFLRVLLYLIPFSAIPISKMIQGLAIATMIVGNLVALYQTNIKRMLAYSSIAHAGYILVGLAATFAGGKFHPGSLAAPLFYLLSYAAMTIGAFAVVSVVAQEKEDAADYHHYLGLATRSPKLAAAMTVFMLSLTGIPPTVGFAGKFFIFREAIAAKLYSLVIVGVVMSAISAYYYLRVIVNMYFGRREEKGGRLGSSLEVSPALVLVILFCVITTIYMGISPSRYLQISSASQPMGKVDPAFLYIFQPPPQ